MPRARMVCRALVAALSLSAAAASPSGAQARPTRPRTISEDLQLFTQVMNQIRVNHPDSVDVHRLIMAAIEGMVQAADPHSFVIPSVRLDSARRVAYLEGKLFPVLIDFQFVQGAPIVSAVVPGSRASRMDILVGDELTDVDGVAVAAQSPSELMYLLAGPKGTSVQLKFERLRADGSIVQLERVVPRERAEELSAVPIATMLDSRTGYVRVTTFNSDKLAGDLNAQIEKLEKAGTQRLILDLRDNGGGRVDQAADVAGAFLPRGTLLYTLWSPKQELIDTGRVSRVFWKSERKYPLIVMINHGTASASELVAGALQDLDRATVVGQTSFGKALVMIGVPLSDGSLMELVVGRISTPCGRVIQRDYRGFSQRHYLRTAATGGATTDTASRPSCKTPAGRTLYGGGGIVPDVILPERAIPAWMNRLTETDLLLTWSGAYVGSHPQLADLDRFASAPLDVTALQEFRALALQRGITIPDDSSATARLEHTLRRMVAYAKWGDLGFFRVAAATDPEIRAAVAAFK